MQRLLILEQLRSRFAKVLPSRLIEMYHKRPWKAHPNRAGGLFSPATAWSCLFLRAAAIQRAVESSRLANHLRRLAKAHGGEEL
jgi:hypothetical protein